MTHTIMSSRVVWLSLALAAGALAAPPQKGIAGLKDDDCPEPGAPALPGPDLALLRGLLWAFEPAPLEVRVQAIEDLGFLGDPRALNPLAQLSLDPNPQVARAAVRAVAAIRHPRAEEILSNVARHPTVQEATRQRAVELLPFQNTWSSVRTIQQLARATPVTATVLVARRLASELPSQTAPRPAPPLPALPAPSDAPATAAPATAPPNGVTP